MTRSLLLWLLLLGASPLAGQIRTIPQALRDSLTSPQTLQSGVRLLPDAECRLGEVYEAGGVVVREVCLANLEEETPVAITGVNSSCGCLWADYSSEPLKRGESTRLQIHYNPKGHPGTVGQRLFIYTTLSASRPTATLLVTGYVTPAADKRGLYPYQAGGALFLRRMGVEFRGECEQRIACLNTGRRVLRVREDRLLTPPGVELKSDPEELAPGGEGDLIIRLADPALFGRSREINLYLDGLGEELPPRRRMIPIRIVAEE